MLWAGIIVPPSGSLRLLWASARSVEDILVVVRISSMALRILFALNLVLGLLFWFNVTDNGGLRLLHMFIGILFVACIWLLGLAQGMTKGGSLGLVIGTFAVGLLIAVFGLVQQSLVGGTTHWVIQVIHLLLALAGVGIGEASAARYRRGVAAASAA
jgi:hypothetical protein